MGNQTKAGKAFEYALMMSLFTMLNHKQALILQQDNVFQNVKNCYDEFGVNEQKAYQQAADAAVKHLITLEPRLTNKIDDMDQLLIYVQSDQSGASGDIRDVLVEHVSKSWGVGISAKNNHTAVKHSRLSSSIDFGEKWLNTPCSENYFVKVKPIFDGLKEIIEKARKESNVLKWRDLSNKDEIYSSVLDAFTEEIRSLNEKKPTEIPQRLLEYLIGTHDFYKVIKLKGKTEIQAFNLHETLNKPVKSIRPVNNVSKLRLPTRIIEIRKVKTNRVNITFDEGWQISLRIHNASTNVEPSLKFDIQLIGRPANAYTHFEPW
jgi:hypothetical protein